MNNNSLCLICYEMLNDICTVYTRNSFQNKFRMRVNNIDINTKKRSLSCGRVCWKCRKYSDDPTDEPDPY